MIEAKNKNYAVMCDSCQAKLPEDFGSFEAALGGSRRSGWESKKVHNGWLDVCPKCFKNNKKEINYKSC